MKKRAVFTVAILVLLTTPPLRAAAAEITDSERARIENEVSDFLGSYLEVLQGDDAEAIRGLYVDDGRFAWFTDGEKRYTSADQVMESLASMEGSMFSTEASDLEIVPLAPHLAHARSAFHTTVTQGGALVYEFSGVMT